MPIFFEKQLLVDTKIGIWEIAEEEYFFTEFVKVFRPIAHPVKRLQHLAGRHLLQVLFPNALFEWGTSPQGGKPIMNKSSYNFSISHGGLFAAVIGSKTAPVGIDIELYQEKIFTIQHKFLSDKEHLLIKKTTYYNELQLVTLCWSIKEAVFKWYEKGSVNFIHDIQIKTINSLSLTADVFFSKTNQQLCLSYIFFEYFVLVWIK